MPKKSKIFFFTVLILSMGIMFSLADLFSSVITVGNFAFLPSQSVKFSPYKIYAISLEKSATNAEAVTKVQDIKMRGGAGLVYQANGLYYCLASAYENQNDALGVQTNLKESGTQSEVIEIAIGGISFDLTLSGTEKNALSNAIANFKTCFKTLYDISVSLDTGVKQLPECKTDVISLQDKASKIKTTFDNVFKTKLSNEIFQTKLKLTELSNQLNVLVEIAPTEKVIYSSMLKESYLKIVLLNKTLAADLS